MANLKLIKEIAKKQNRTIEDIAKAVGLKAHAIHKMARDGSTTIETLERIADVLKVPSWIFFDDKLTVDELIRINMNGHHNAQSVFGSATLYEGTNGSAASASVVESTQTNPSCSGPTTNTDSSAMLEAKDTLIKNLTAQVEDLRRDKHRLEREVDRLRAKYEPD